MAENIHRGLDEEGNPVSSVTDDHKDAPEKPAPDVERLAPIPESTVTVRGDDVGGHCKMTASEYRKYVADRKAREDKAAQVEADAESAANEVRMDAQMEQEQQDADDDELAELGAAEAAEAAELAAAEAAELAAAEAAELAELGAAEAAEREAEARGRAAKESAENRQADIIIADANAPEKVEI